jgi:hypothetical protein
MDYFPATLYQKQMVQFWPVIDDKLRKGRKWQMKKKFNWLLTAIRFLAGF